MVVKSIAIGYMFDIASSLGLNMLAFLANNLDQLDLAFDHLTKGDPNNARFGLMLTDNVLEITLHQVARQKADELKAFPHLGEKFTAAKQLEEALGRAFEPKVKFARSLDLMKGEHAESILTLHTFRNEVYHVGVHQEAILGRLGIFYFKLACDMLGDFDPIFLSWSSSQILPERAKKYFNGHVSFPGSKEQYQRACRALSSAIGFIPAELISVLADHMHDVVEGHDASIDLVATGAPRQSTRDQVIVDCQAWPLCFNEKGKEKMREKGWSGRTALDNFDWIVKNYPLRFRSDPIPSWRRRVVALRREQSPHGALKKYRSFMDQTAGLRESIDEAARQVDAYIDDQIEHMKLERAGLI